jgi:hypothetical protein
MLLEKRSDAAAENLVGVWLDGFARLLFALLSREITT